MTEPTDDLADLEPELADAYALLRAQIAEDGDRVRMIIESVNGYALMAILCGLLVDWGSELMGSTEELDRRLERWIATRGEDAL